jgi:hypothetical protein
MYFLNYKEKRYIKQNKRPVKVALGAALGARAISPFMAAHFPESCAALGTTVGAALYAPPYAVGGATAGAAAGAVLDAPLYATEGTTMGATAGTVRGATGLGVGRGCFLKIIVVQRYPISARGIFPESP